MSSSVPQIEELRSALHGAENGDVNLSYYITKARKAASSLEAYVRGLEDANHTYMTQNREMRGKK
jgi:hypothetical protein